MGSDCMRNSFIALLTDECLLQNKLKSTVTGVEMFRKTLDHGQVRKYYVLPWLDI